MLYTKYYNSPIGKLLLVEKDSSLVGVWMENQKYFLGSLKNETLRESDTEVLNKTKEWLDSYFKGEKPTVDVLKLAPEGTKFQKEVWKILFEIPYGEVTTYGEISKKISISQEFRKISARAVGGAVGHNPLSIIIPCYRVIGKNGSLTGYAGGLEKKIKLLNHEGVDMKKLFVPKKENTF